MLICRHLAETLCIRNSFARLNDNKLLRWHKDPPLLKFRCINSITGHRTEVLTERTVSVVAMAVIIIESTGPIFSRIVLTLAIRRTSSIRQLPLETTRAHTGLIPQRLGAPLSNLQFVAVHSVIITQLAPPQDLSSTDSTSIDLERLNFNK